MQYILQTCKKIKPAGLHVVQPDPNELRSRILEGYQLLAYSIDAVFINSSAKIPKF